MHLPADLSSPARARALVHHALEGRACSPDVIDQATLLVSELVTNAVMHARTPMEVNVHVGAHEVRVEVQDESAELPKALIPSSQATGGRGLQLVARLARSWGVEHHKPGKVVWFELATSPRC